MPVAGVSTLAPPTPAAAPPRGPSDSWPTDRGPPAKGVGAPSPGVLSSGGFTPVAGVMPGSGASPGPPPGTREAPNPGCGRGGGGAVTLVLARTTNRRARGWEDCRPSIDSTRNAMLVTNDAADVRLSRTRRNTSECTKRDVDATASTVQDWRTWKRQAAVPNHTPWHVGFERVPWRSKRRIEPQYGIQTHRGFAADGGRRHFTF
jgi:hypothetical protein